MHELLKKIKIGNETKLENVELKFEGIGREYYPRVKLSYVFKLWSFRFGQGNEEKYLITNPNENIKDGDKIVLRPIETKDVIHYLDTEFDLLPPKKIINKWARKLEVNTQEKTKQEKWDEIKDKLKNDTVNEPFIFVKEFKILNPKKLEDIKVNRVFNEYLFGNTKNIEKSFEWLLKPKTINFGNTCRPNNQKYSGHLLLMTNSATGKTTTAEKVALKIDSASSSGMAGFSTADSVNQGQINLTYKPILCDDITGNKFESKFLNGLPNLMRDGIHRTNKGKSTVETKTMSPFIFTVNPENNDEMGLLHEFNDLMAKFTEIPQQTASRMPLIFFNSRTENVETRVEYTDNEMKKLEAIVEYISDLLSGVAGKLLNKDKIQMWIEKPDKNYENRLRNLSKKVSLCEVRDFIANQPYAFRGIKGEALKLALIDIIDKIGVENLNNFFDHVNLSDLIERAEDYFDTLKHVNMNSFENIIQASEDITEYYKRKVEDEKRAYIRVLVKAISKRFTENPDYVEIILDELEDVIGDVGEGRYKHFSSLKQALPENTKTLERWLKPYGLDVVKHNKITKFKIKDKQQIETIGKIYSENEDNGGINNEE